MECKICGKDYPAAYLGPDSVCKECYNSMSDKEKETRGIQENTEESEQKSKYSTLKTISKLCKIFAVIIGVITFLIFLGVITQNGIDIISTPVLITTLIIGIMNVIIFSAFAEIIKLFIDLGVNSKHQTKLLEKIVKED